MRVPLSANNYTALLAIVAVGILTGGILLKPEKKETPVVVSESEMARLERVAQKEDLQDIASFFGSVAEEALKSLVYLKDARVTGIVWDTPPTIVTASLDRPLSARMTVLLPGGEESASEIAVSSPEVPVATAQLPSGAGLKAARISRSNQIPAGSWVVAVSRRPDGGERLVTPGLYSGTRSVFCGGFEYQGVETSLPLSPWMAGAGLFDLDGRMVALVTRCDEQYAAISAQDIPVAVQRLAGAAQQMMARFGMRVAPLEELGGARFGVDAGLIIDEIWHSAAADRAGFKVGDVLVAVNGQPVRSAGDFLPFLSSPDPLALEYARQGRRRKATLAAGPQAPASPDGAGKTFGLSFRPPSQGFLVERVDPGSPASRAGLRAGDRLLEADSRPLRPADVRRLLSKAPDQPVYLTIQRGQRELGILVE